MYIGGDSSSGGTAESNQFRALSAAAAGTYRGGASGGFLEYCKFAESPNPNYENIGASIV